MYSESDIDGAVAAGVLSPAAATAFRNHMAALRQAPAVDEEQFRLLTGFNDIFVSIAIVMLLVAVGWIGAAMATPLGPMGVAAASWVLAEYFTGQRRMALPSIVLLLAFLAGVAWTPLAWLIAHGNAVEAQVKDITVDRDVQTAIVGVLGAGIAALTALAAWLHWRRFMVPITVAAAALAGVGVVISLILAVVPGASAAILPIVLTAGLAVFAFAMWWDLRDPLRRTRRSDVAFWLHLAAAPMIAHALFNVIGVFEDAMNGWRALLVLLLYAAFGFVALLIDRRALLVSSLAYVLYALSTLFQTAGAVELSAAFTALVIGSALLLLSAFWHKVRQHVVGLVGPALAGRLPPVNMAT
ncbi:hypothetical protein [Sphingomonas dokdonensis]|uniref:DUF2157 domain-containing protein n=1 Tax=Sphingomonas dokdonensis TaxID=344880 RepID=A0A245ZW17_9SPHN|nr:hypothetical protein [Sphingomonas dokdonensis]OWK33929.1 hypothetical protein SPDO_08180 [Sphingomonas dokdonensis]